MEIKPCPSGCQDEPGISVNVPFGFRVSCMCGWSGSWEKTERDAVDVWNAVSDAMALARNAEETLA